jgi:ribulose-5-phosphate 4-epimerase/fuculose-1-phosphate aldolase
MPTAEFSEFEKRFVQNGLAEPEGILMGTAENRLKWSRPDPEIPILAPLFDRLDRRALIRLRPAEPYQTIVRALAAGGGPICPEDCETRLFLTDLPVLPSLDARALRAAFSRRSAVVVRDGEIVAASRAGLKQAFVTASSVCFSCFVKFFGELLHLHRRGCLTDADRRRLELLYPAVEPPQRLDAPLAKGPFEKEPELLSAISEAGKKVVDLRLVDACFGNISCRAADRLYISRTGTFLDDLDGQVAKCPLDDPPERHPEASSELPAHLEIIRRTGCRAILHGHPRFSVVLSMDCTLTDCPFRGSCHRHCPYERRACGDIPVVSGEVGGGEFGLCHTVAPAICNAPGVIVYGHGVFTCDAADFTGALQRLIEIERRCFDVYFEHMGITR